ncbi:unnamed protein product [Brassica rapa subsp. trilocularis]
MSCVVALSRRLHVEEDRCKRSCVGMREVCVGESKRNFLWGSSIKGRQPRAAAINTQRFSDKTQGLVFGDRGAQTERVMNAIFPEEGMLLFHRVSLEMSFADNFLVNRNRRTPPPREIIELDDDDDEMGEGSQPTMRTAGEGAAANAPRGRNAQAEAPPIFWDVGMNVVDYTARRGSPLPTEARVENGMMFWEGLANEEEALAGEMNVVMEAENLNVGVAVGVTDNIALANNVVTPTVEAVRVDDGGGSSTGSTDLILTTGRHQVKLPNNVQVGNEESPIIHGPSRELVAAQGLVLASTAVAGSGRTVSEATLPSMMKLAMCCTVKEGGTSRAVNRATETSSEGSTTDGGC